MTAGEAFERFVETMCEEALEDRDGFPRRLRRISTARLREIRRAVDAELAKRTQPSEDLRDRKARIQVAAERAETLAKAFLATIAR